MRRGLYRRGLKRAIDAVAAGVLLTAGAPVLVSVALLVRAGLGAPVLFTQRRPGLGGKPFTMFKFRTMTNATDAHGRPLGDSARLTRLGRWLRRTSLDELPELYNVLRGDMSLVGPRPLLMRYQPYYRPRERLREQVRPGITGWAQVRGRNHAPWDARLEYDAQYVERHGARFDAQILVQTMRQVARSTHVEVDPTAVMQDLDVQRRATVRVTLLRSAQASDLVALHRRAVEPDALAATIFAGRGVAAYYADVLAGEPSHQVLGAFEGSTLLGYAHIRKMHNASHLNQIATAPQARGRGIGRALLEAWIAAAQNQRQARLTLDVREDTNAQRWYARQGFRVRARSCLWELRARTGGPPAAIALQETRTEARRHARYGFSRCRASVHGRDYAIGRLGSEVFRAPAHTPTEVLEALLSVRPIRTVLVDGDETPPEIHARHVSTTIRMERLTGLAVTS